MNVINNRSATCLMFIVIALMISIGQLSAHDGDQPIAVIVNQDNVTESLSIDQLKHIYLGEITSLKGQGKITLIEYTPLSYSFYDQLLNMTVTNVRRHWIKVVFSGEFASPPLIARNPGELDDLMTANDGSIGFCLGDEIPENCKIIKIDGLIPGDTGYPFFYSEEGH